MGSVIGVEQAQEAAVDDGEHCFVLKSLPRPSEQTATPCERRSREYHTFDPLYEAAAASSSAVVGYAVMRMFATQDRQAIQSPADASHPATVVVRYHKSDSKTRQQHQQQQHAIPNSPPCDTSTASA